MKCLVQQMKQIAATRHSNDHLWAGPWTLIWSASSWRTAAHSNNKCSRMQPQSSSHYPPIHQPRKTLGRENMLPPKNLHDRQQQSVTLVHWSTADLNELHLHFSRGRLHIHIKRRSEELEIVLVFDFPEQSFSSLLPVSSHSILHSVGFLFNKKACHPPIRRSALIPTAKMIFTRQGMQKLTFKIIQ